MATTCGFDSTVGAGARQLSLLAALRRDVALQQCRALLDSPDWRIDWWADLALLDRRYLLARIHAPKEWADWEWARIPLADQDRIMVAVGAATDALRRGCRR